MDILLTVLAVIFCLVGLIGCIVPALPGPPFTLLALFFMHWTSGVQFSTNFLLLWTALTIVVTILDYLLPAWMTNRFGGSRSATIGATVGLIVGMLFFPPVGIILGPFFGALIGELMQNSRDSAKAFKVAMGSLVAFMAGTGLKLICAGFMTFYVIRSIVGWIF